MADKNRCPTCNKVIAKTRSEYYHENKEKLKDKRSDRAYLSVEVVERLLAAGIISESSVGGKKTKKIITNYTNGKLSTDQGKPTED